jgi:hypothetical protein
MTKGGAAYIMLLYDLLETRIVELGKLGQLVDVGDDVAQVLLEQLKVVLDGAVGIAVLPLDDLVDLPLGGAYAADDLIALDLCEGVDLV